MKTLYILLILLVFSSSSAQKKVTVADLSGAKGNVISFACGGGGNAGVVVKITRLIEAEKYLEVKKLISSGIPAEKFFSAVCCDKLSTLNKIKLSTAEKNLIYAVYNSNEIVYSCSGCTYIEAKSIKEYVYSKEDKLIISQINYLVDKLLK